MTPDEEIMFDLTDEELYELGNEAIRFLMFRKWLVRKGGDKNA